MHPHGFSFGPLVVVVGFGEGVDEGIIFPREAAFTSISDTGLCECFDDMNGCDHGFFGDMAIVFKAGEFIGSLGNGGGGGLFACGFGDGRREAVKRLSGVVVFGQEGFVARFEVQIGFEIFVGIGIFFEGSRWREAQWGIGNSGRRRERLLRSCGGR